jgi:hypothetical protein
MSDVFTKLGYKSGWNEDFFAASVPYYLKFSGTNVGDPISVGAHNSSSHRTNSDGTVDSCVAPHINNCKYLTADTVLCGVNTRSLISESDVLLTETTIRWSYTDDTPTNTVLSSVLLFAYNGSNIATAPTGINIYAFEVQDDGDGTVTIYRDRSSDTPGDGGAWDNTGVGVGGIANALICSDRTTAAIHYFYFGLSAKLTAKGLKSYTLRFDFDAQ